MVHCGYGSLAVEDAASTFAALGSEQRLAVLNSLVRAGPEGLPVGTLGERSGVTGANLTYHVRVLAQAGLVRRVKAGTLDHLRGGRLPQSERAVGLSAVGVLHRQPAPASRRGPCVNLPCPAVTRQSEQRPAVQRRSVTPKPLHRTAAARAGLSPGGPAGRRCRGAGTPLRRTAARTGASLLRVR